MAGCASGRHAEEIAPEATGTGDEAERARVENLRSLPAAVWMAEKVGAGLGEREVLQRSVSGWEKLEPRYRLELTVCGWG